MRPLWIGSAALLSALALGFGGDTPRSPGDLDQSFGDQGRSFFAVGEYGAVATASVLQADNKIVLAGYTFFGGQPTGNEDFVVVRLNANGTLDTTFGSGGIARTPIDLRLRGLDHANDVALGPGGTITVAGRSETASGGWAMSLVRYTSSGSLDPTFDGDGIWTLDLTNGADFARSVAIQPDGKAVAAGSSYAPPTPWPGWTVLRLNLDGSFDSTFDADGIAVTAVGDPAQGDKAEEVEILGNGRLLVGGVADESYPTMRDFTIARYMPDGSLDSTFGNDGVVVTLGGRSDQVTDLEVLPDGRLILAGDARGYDPYDAEFRIARYLASGQIDSSFGTGGIVLLRFPGTWFSNLESVAVQADGKLVAGGRAEYNTHAQFALARFLENGSLDPSFGNQGLRTWDFSCENDWGGPIVIQQLDVAREGFRERIVQAAVRTATGTTTWRQSAFRRRGRRLRLHHRLRLHRRLRLRHRHRHRRRLHLRHRRRLHLHQRRHLRHLLHLRRHRLRRHRLHLLRHRSGVVSSHRCWACDWQWLAQESVGPTALLAESAVRAPGAPVGVE